jgi:hypothetical protein
MHRWYAVDENANTLKLECLQDEVSAVKTAGEREGEAVCCLGTYI